MEKPNQGLRWGVVFIAIAALFCFIAVLFISDIVQVLYGTSIINSATLDPRLCFVVAVPGALGALWISYRNSFIGLTYSDKQRRALKAQAAALAFGVVALSFLYATGETAFLFALSILVVYAGINAVANQVVLVYHHPIFFKPRNTGWPAVIFGVVQIGVGIGILLLSAGVIK